MANSEKKPANAPKDKQKREEKLDEAIADSMIASDPPAIVSKGEPTAPAHKNPPAPGEKRTRRPGGR